MCSCHRNPPPLEPLKCIWKPGPFQARDRSQLVGLVRDRLHWPCTASFLLCPLHIQWYDHPVSDAIVFTWPTNTLDSDEASIQSQPEFAVQQQADSRSRT